MKSFHNDPKKLDTSIDLKPINNDIDKVDIVAQSSRRPQTQGTYSQRYKQDSKRPSTKGNGG